MLMGGAFVALHFWFRVGLLWEFGAGGVICIGCFAGVINGMFCSPAFLSAYEVLTVMLSLSLKALPLRIHSAHNICAFW